jgi:hypothetical protein
VSGISERQLFTGYGLPYEVCVRCGGPGTHAIESQEMGSRKPHLEYLCDHHAALLAEGDMYTPTHRVGLATVKRIYEVGAYQE